MNIPLKPFQEDYVLELHGKAARALENWRRYDEKQIISFTAPTGAGKTIMMASFIESMLCGDNEGRVTANPDSIFIWLSDDPNLNEQSKRKLMKYCDKMVLSQFVTLDENFRGEKLEPRSVYFLNTQKLSRTSRMTQIGDERDWTIWQIIENTIEEYGKDLVLVIDEAHRGARTNQTTIMQRFVLGFNNQEEGELQPLPFIIGMSATPERFNALAGASLSTVSKVVVPPAKVRDSGLLKDRIEIHFPEASVINKNIAVLQAAADEWKDKCQHWSQYTTKQQLDPVNPIFVVQVEAGTSDKVTTTDLEECLQEIEKRTGEQFESGEVVHSFGEKETLSVNGIEIPYCESSAINDDENIKVVLFKEALSTGWDCPRAEAMMSYRVAKDATYIAQLLGRMIRTPLRSHIEMDESLNYVHLYLPHFDESTVEDVVKRLTEEEGGVLPTDVQPVQGGNRKKVRMTVNRPVFTQHTPEPTTTVESHQPQTQTTTHAETPKTENPSTDKHKGENLEMIVEKWIEPTPKSENPFEDVKTAINNAEILTYDVKRTKKNPNYVRMAFNMARLGIKSGMDATGTAVRKIKEEIVELIHLYIEEKKKSGEYAALVEKALEMKLNTISFEFYKGGNLYESHQGQNLFSKTYSGLEHQFKQAEAVLCNEGIGGLYADKYEDEDDEYAYMYDVILYAADEHQRDIRMKYAEKEFIRLANLYRPLSKDLPENYRIEYDNLISEGEEPLPRILKLSDNPEFDLDIKGETCKDHLFVNEQGTATFDLDGWESLTLKEERKHPDYVCWLRNQLYKSWTLCIPYKMGDEPHSMNPDFIVVRRKDNGKYEFGLLEPHCDDKKDNLYKAKGLVKYAQDCRVFDRIQMLREKQTPSGKKMLRLDFTRLDVQKGVMKCGDDITKFDALFDEMGFFD